MLGGRREKERNGKLGRWRSQRVEGEVAPGGHGRGERGHEGGGLDVEIAKHGIRAPATDEANEVGVDLGAEESHGAARAEGAGLDIGGGEAIGGAMRGDKATEEGSHGAGSESVSDSVAADRGVEGVDGGGRRGAEEAEVADAANESADGAERGVTAEAMPDLFTTDSVLLGGEGEHDEGGEVKIGVRTKAKVQTAAANEEFNVSKEKGMRVGRCHRIFTGTHEKVEANDHHVGAGEDKGGRTGFREGVGGGQLEKTDRNGFDARRGRIGATIGAKLAVQAKVNSAVRVQARVRGPQKGARLAHVTEGGINRRSSDGLSTFGGLSGADAMSEDLEQGDGVVDVGEKGIHGQGVAEGLPNGPGAVGCVAGRRNDPGSHRVVCKAKVSDESTANGGGRQAQGVAWG